MQKRAKTNVSGDADRPFKSLLGSKSFQLQINVTLLAPPQQDFDSPSRMGFGKPCRSWLTELSSCLPAGRLVCVHLQFPRDSGPKIDSWNFYHQNIYFAYQPLCIQSVWGFTVLHLSKTSSQHLEDTYTVQLNVPARASTLWRGLYTTMKYHADF